MIDTTNDTKTPTGPTSDEIPRTAAEWVIAAHADAAAATDKVLANLAYYCSGKGHAQHVDLIIRKQTSYALMLAMTVLDRISPAAADALAEHLHDAADYGDSYGEWLWQWGEELQAGQPITLPFDLPGVGA